MTFAPLDEGVPIRWRHSRTRLPARRPRRRTDPRHPYRPEVVREGPEATARPGKIPGLHQSDQETDRAAVRGAHDPVDDPRHEQGPGRPGLHSSWGASTMKRLTLVMDNAKPGNARLILEQDESGQLYLTTNASSRAAGRPAMYRHCVGRQGGLAGSSAMSIPDDVARRYVAAGTGRRPLTQPPPETTNGRRVHPRGCRPACCRRVCYTQISPGMAGRHPVSVSRPPHRRFTQRGSADPMATQPRPRLPARWPRRRTDPRHPCRPEVLREGLEAPAHPGQGHGLRSSVARLTARLSEVLMTRSMIRVTSKVLAAQPRRPPPAPRRGDRELHHGRAGAPPTARTPWATRFDNHESLHRARR